MRLWKELQYQKNLQTLTGEAALEAIATADACTQSMFEDRKVRLSEIVK